MRIFKSAKNSLTLTVVFFLSSITALQVRAGVIVQHTNPSSIYNLADAYIGQSFTTPTGQSYTDIKFSWLNASNDTQLAVGTLYLFETEYNPTPGSLSSLVSGQYYAKSESITSGAYEFGPSVTLYGGTKYYAYMDNSGGLLSGATSSLNSSYSGGDYYQPGSGGGTPPSYQNASINYVLSSTSYDAHFRLQGTVVPEPNTAIAMGLLGVVGFAGNRRRRRASDSLLGTSEHNHRSSYMTEASL